MIQTNWRRTNMKRKLGDLKWAALFVRAARLRVAATRRFLRLRNAATAIGKTARGWLRRRRFLTLKKCCVRVQANSRRVVQRRRFVRFCGSVVAVQTVLRTFLARRRFLAQRRAVIKIQAAARRGVGRRGFRRLKGSALQLQALARAGGDKSCQRATRNDGVQRTCAGGSKEAMGRRRAGGAGMVRGCFAKRRYLNIRQAIAPGC